MLLCKLWNLLDMSEMSAISGQWPLLGTVDISIE